MVLEKEILVIDIIPPTGITEQNSTSVKHATSVHLPYFRFIAGMSHPQFLITQPSRGFITV